MRLDKRQANVGHGDMWATSSEVEGLPGLRRHCQGYNPSAEGSTMSDRGVKHSPEDMRDLKWSPSEKEVARKAFETALSRELKAVIAETKRLAARIEQPDDLWELERYLAAKRKEIDETFDYRYSVLPLVLGSLIRQRRLGDQELKGLSEDKLSRIRGVAAL
jgi:Photoprotection regulator fluorescence recovery protein